ncbi:hypothetical protein BU25DRAFT_354922, partial [Macroventuria anomochaeta]
LTPRQAISLHKAVLWPVLLSTHIIMEGYGIVLIYYFFAQPAFSRKWQSVDTFTLRHKYDECDDSGNSQITAPWQSGLGNAVGCDTIIDAFANGYFCHKFGYRPVLLLPVLLVGKFLCGIQWLQGVFATMAPAYTSEVCPMALRGYLVVYVNLCWAFGQLISASVQSAFSGGNIQWSYQILFAIQWAWPIPLFLILFFAPESP